ncbi:twin-arginine translocation pathway signal [Salipiger aestuarii]|uniref:DUF1513 domain-containing protein n=1 Tax=Salipiger aestuarii TaxID=568098 RepID=A0A327YE61_9RHOB|nr:DUF1513 domain-containing protein [Salipiger aestuarii]EIE52621.1 hypothetical protein C357_02401 [Citreicella sp. 357]KAB2542449.1 twin-arginine translocation pathway signal [Salipiger aestuarii]RAK18781.1 hypothetical protein ATI53_101160 [Salipiger aestuarii]
MTTRRVFIASLLAASANPAAGWAAVGGPTYLAAAKCRDGSHMLAGLREDGSVAFTVPLPARGHAAAAHPERAEAVGFARRPGSYAMVVDCRDGTVLHRLSAPQDRQFNGHGTFSPDGALLYTCEQRVEDSEGFVGIWDTAASYSRIGEFRSHGVGPHDIRVMPDHQSLVIANGGIRTDRWDRAKLNIDVMRPNLVYVDVTGALLERRDLPGFYQNSIRHLAVRGDGLVGLAMQWEGEAGYAPPLLALHRRGAPPVLCEAPLQDELAMGGYAGSVAFSGDGSEIAITSPRGGRIHRFSDGGVFLGAVSRADVCGLAPHAGGYVASDGLGGMLLLRGGTLTALARADVAWDNHLVAIRA